MSIETWVTDRTGTYKAHLERSEASPFRRFAFSLERGAEPGTGSLEHHLDNALLREQPDLLEDGSLVWMRYRGKTRVWIIEERAAVLDEGEHATDWVKVSGSGSLALLADRLVFPPAFAAGANLEPSTWGKDNQWRRFVNRAGGELLWDLIDESNPRFATQITRGTIESDGADGWTQDFRFDTILDVVDAVVAAYGEVELDGLTFNYRTSPGADLTGTVIFEEAGDLLRVERAESDRDTKSWLVAEGVGEGVTAKLRLATDASIGRRREAYLDAKDAGNTGLLQVMATAALGELRRRDSLALEVAETRYRAFIDYDLHDQIRAIAPSRDIDAAGRIVAMYVAEADDERVRVSIDLNTPREDELIRLEEGNRSAASSIGIRNRQPQGQLVPFSFSGQGVFDTDDTLEVHLFIPDRMYVTVEARAALDFRQFFAPAKDAASGGGSTSGSSVQQALIPVFRGTGTFAVGIDQPSGGIAGLEAAYTSAGSGEHGATPHVHVETEVASHDHTVPAHTHNLTYGVFKEAYPASHSVTLKVYELVAGVWTLRTTISGLTNDQEDVDLTAWITGPGQWMLTLQSAAAQPNGGRLGAYVSGFVLGAIQSS